MGKGVCKDDFTCLYPALKYGQSRADGLVSLRFLLYGTAPEDTMSLDTWLAFLLACWIISLSPVRAPSPPWPVG